MKLSGHILLVEDNAINQIVASTILENAGLIVTVANDGQEALDILVQGAADKFSLIIMDCQMPIMNGYQATENIRMGLCGEQYRDKIIIAMTANAMEGDKQKCLEVGMNDFLSKPVEPLKVLNTLKKYL